MDFKEGMPIIIIVIFVLWDFAKHVMVGKDSDLKSNTEAVIRLTERLDHVERTITGLLTMDKDLNEAHSKIRVIESKLEN